MSIGTSCSGKLPVIDLKKTGQNIARMRTEKGISIRELQVMLGFTSPQTIYNWQSGNSLPSVDHFIVLAAILGSTISEIIAIEGEDTGIERHADACPQLLS